jgi:fructan beta-fructosidase
MKLFKIFPITFAIIIVFAGCLSTKEEPVSSSLEYQDKHRPQFHFTPQANWMNDPNGMFYFKGKYHLFYQYFPDSTVWGPMHWGHAESSDLVHWQHLPIALYPDSLGCIFSGGAVVDNNNTSGLGSEKNPPIIATFTHHDFVGEKAKTNDFQKQSLAYSLNGGYDWKKYHGNPVIPNVEKIKDFRDPKVVWHEESENWILSLAAYDKVKFYSSQNLIDWTFISDFGIEGDNRLWECPDLFPIQEEGSNEVKWVLIVSIQKEAPNGGTASSYFIGDFDGKNFISDADNQKWLDWGTDNYAFVTWNNLPEKHRQVKGIGWMSNWQYAQTVPTEKWRSAMTLPRELRLSQSSEGYLLKSLPVKELQYLRKDSATISNLEISDEKIIKEIQNPSQAEMVVDLNLAKTDSDAFGFKIYNDLGEKLVIEFNKSTNQMSVDRTQSNVTKFSDVFYEDVHTVPIDLSQEELKLHIFIDVASIEIFINDGEASYTGIFFPSKDFETIALFSKNGEFNISNSKFYSLNSIWNTE